MHTGTSGQVLVPGGEHRSQPRLPTGTCGTLTGKEGEAWPQPALVADEQKKKPRKSQFDLAEWLLIKYF